MRILGIETSCDETAAAVVEEGNKLLSNVVASSIDLHKAYGGVVPEIAARSHIESILPVIFEALSQALQSKEARVKRQDKKSHDSFLMTLTSNEALWDQIDAIAVTYGAGLGGSLLIGVLTARTLAIIKKKPLYAINHVEGHIYANFITEKPYNVERITYNAKTKSRNTLYEIRNTNSSGSQKETYELPKVQPRFPMLALVVSGGHTQLVLFRDHFDYTLLGRTHDDAIGEAFDKVAKIIGLPYPGGPSIEQAAAKGNPMAFDFPKAKLPAKYDFSFSGIKTAVLRSAQAAIGENYTFPSSGLPKRLSEAQKTDIAASFQRVAIETVVDKTVMAYEEFRPKSVVIGGGVAASQELRRQLAERLPISINYTDPKLCTDNGAMIAALGCFKAEHNQPAADPCSLEIAPNLTM